MNVFIDCGAYSGDSVEEFKNWRKIAFPDKTNWQLYAFEPNPKFKDYWDNQTHENLTFSNMAVWVEDTEMDFAVDQNEEPVGSSLMLDKVNVKDSPKIRVQAFNFSEWLKQFMNDFVVLKVDIEGSEFAVLNKMIKDGTDLIPYVMMVEFHPNKVPEFTTTDKDNLINLLKKRKANIVEWH